jgi:plastocyanin
VKRGALVLPAAAALSLLASSVVAGAAGGTIKGTIRGAEADGAPVADAVVMLDGPSVRAAPDAPHAVMDQRQDTFVPHVLAVAAGTTVDFPNSDPRLHNVFSTSPAEKFDLGMYEQGEVKSVTFDTPGVVEVRCNVHPKMRAFVVVHANPYVGVSDRAGSYTIAGVPPGKYQLRVWQEQRADAKLDVTVGEGQVLPFDLRLERRR